MRVFMVCICMNLFLWFSLIHFVCSLIIWKICFLENPRLLATPILSIWSVTSHLKQMVRRENCTICKIHITIYDTNDNMRTEMKFSEKQDQSFDSCPMASIPVYWSLMFYVRKRTVFFILRGTFPFVRELWRTRSCTPGRRNALLRGRKTGFGGSSM